MKTKKIQGKVEVLLVTDIPSNAEYIGTPTPNTLEFFDGKSSHYLEVEEDSKWEYLCKLSEITEEQADLVAEQTDNPYWHGQGFEFIDYKDDSNCFKTALESFQSLLEANGVTKVNPYRQQFDKYFHIKHFEQAELNVFAPEKTLVFIAK